MELTPPRGTADLLPPRSEAMLGLYDFDDLEVLDILAQEVMPRL